MQEQAIDGIHEVCDSIDHDARTFNMQCRIEVRGKELLACDLA